VLFYHEGTKNTKAYPARFVLRVFFIILLLWLFFVTFVPSW